MKIEKPIRERAVYIGFQPLPLAVYLFGLCAAMIYILCRSQMALYTAVMTAVAWGTALLFYLIKKIRVVPYLAIACLGIVCYVLLRILPMTGDESFIDFVFTSSTFFKVEYAICASVIFGVIIGFSSCFFSVYSPRPAMLLLPAYIPLILSSRTAGGLPEWIVIIIVAGYIMSVAGIARIKPLSTLRTESAPNAKRERLAAIFATGAAVALLLIALPRSAETPYSETLDEISAPAGGYHAVGLTNFSSKSSVNTGANDSERKLLFTVQADSPVLLARWYFDEYNGGDGWIKGEERLGYPNWETDAYYTDCARLVATIKNALEWGLLGEYADVFSELEYSTNDKGVCDGGFETNSDYRIKSRDGSSVAVIIHPERTRSVVTPNDATTFRTEMGEIFTKDNMPEYSSYTVSAWNDKPNESFIKALENISYSALLDDALEQEVIHTAQYNALLNEYNTAREYGYTYNSKSGGISDDIRQLAAQITDGLESDYEKALAIEKWFGEAGFVYDRDYVPGLPEADYFLFKSKRGICSDFATASVLLARAAGLTAKYAEGFALSEDIRGEDGLFYVTDEQAHAYALVYIKGYGWLSVDGTRYVPMAQESNSEWNIAVTIIVVAAVAIIALCVIFREKLRELIFRIMFPLRGHNGKLKSLYKALRRMSCKVSGADENSVTVGEVCNTVSGALGLPQEAERLKVAFDGLFYDESGAQSADPAVLYADYKAALKAKRRLGR